MLIIFFYLLKRHLLAIFLFFMYLLFFVIEIPCHSKHVCQFFSLNLQYSMNYSFFKCYSFLDHVAFLCGLTQTFSKRFWVKGENKFIVADSIRITKSELVFLLLSGCNNFQDSIRRKINLCNP